MEKTSPAEAFPGTGTDEITDPTMNLPTMESTTSHTDLARHNGQLNKMYCKRKTDAFVENKD